MLKSPINIVSFFSELAFTSKYGVDVLHQPALHPIFSYWVGKTESGFIVRSVETGLR